MSEEWSDRLPPVGTESQVVVLAAREGEAREHLIEAWVRDARAEGHDCWTLDCDAARFGPFAGLEAWLLALVPRLEDMAPDLISRHSYELLKAVPQLRERYAFRRLTLTETASVDEAVRNYALDRAFRIGQGIVDLLVAWHDRSRRTRWVVVADNFDRSSGLVRRFFLELIRRRADRLDLTIVFVLEPDTAVPFLEGLEAVCNPTRVRVPLPAGRREHQSPQDFRRRALELEQAAGRQRLATEIHLPEIIYNWQRSDEPNRALRWQAIALWLYTHYGYYEDAYPYCEVVLDHLDELTIELTSVFSRWTLVASVFGCLVAIGQAERACAIVTTEGLEKIDDPVDQSRICYVLAMFHARFLPAHDFPRAEAYIAQGLAALSRCEGNEQVRRLLSVSLRNGLAFIRQRQGRTLEAVSLCEGGLTELDQHFRRDSHRLHRSVLLYTSAQVYAALESHAKAIESLSAALEMEPNCAEYYNERGNVYQQMGRFQPAIMDYRKAVEVSSPYPEVWTNLGQCYRQMKDLANAAAAYERALDLDPHFRTALIGHADVCVRRQHWDRALADYDMLLANDPAQPPILANRALVLGQLGRFEEAIEHLTRAIGLAPDEPFLYEMRAAACIRLGRTAQVDEDLRTLELLQAGNARSRAD